MLQGFLENQESSVVRKKKIDLCMPLYGGLIALTVLSVIDLIMISRDAFQLPSPYFYQSQESFGR